MKKNIVTGIIFLSALATGSVFGFEMGENIPKHLELKVPKEKITKAELIGDEVIYQYVGVISPPEKGEIYEKRTPNIKFFEGEKEGEIVAEISAENAYQKQGDDWYNLEYATTTKESFEAQTTPLLAKLAHAFDYEQISANNSTISGGNGTYATSRTTAGSNNNAATNIGQNFTGGIYVVMRGFLKFDTNLLDDSAIISQVRFKGSFSAINDPGGTNPDFRIFKYDWSAQDPIAAGNREAAYDGCFSAAEDNNIWLNLAGKVINTEYTSGDLDTAWVNKTGSTYYCFRSSRDINADTPTENESANLNLNSNATAALRPTILITYTLPSGAGSRFITFD